MLSVVELWKSDDIFTMNFRDFGAVIEHLSKEYEYWEPEARNILGFQRCSDFAL